MLDTETRLSRVDNTSWRKQPGHTWLTTKQMAQLLCTDSSQLYREEMRAAIRSQSRSLNGSQAQGTGLLWYRPDADELMRFRRECRLPLKYAAQVLTAYREGRLEPKP